MSSTFLKFILNSILKYFKKYNDKLNKVCYNIYIELNSKGFDIGAQESVKLLPLSE